MESNKDIYYINYDNKMKKEKVRLRHDINVIIKGMPAIVFIAIGLYFIGNVIVSYIKYSGRLDGFLLMLLAAVIVSMLPFGIAIVIIDRAIKSFGYSPKHMVGEFFVFHDDVMEIHFRGDFDSSKVQRVYTYNKNEITKDSSFIYEKASQFLRISSPSDFVIYDDYQNGIISSDTPKDDDPDYHREGLLEFHTTTGSAENDEKLVNRIREFAGKAYQEY